MDFNGVWRSVEWFNDFEVNVYGVIRNKKTGYIKKQALRKTGKRYYRYVAFSVNGKIYSKPVSHIVAKSFPEICGEWFEGCEVHHINRDTENNSAYNLQILSKEQHRLEHRHKLRFD